MFKHYTYTAKPEGQDPVGKIVGCLKLTIPASTLLSLHDIFIFSNCQTLSSIFKRILFWSVPINSLGIIFPSITFASTRIRGKDDVWNHGIGALATVPVFRTWLKTPFPTTMQIAFAITAIAIINKGFREDFNDVTIKVRADIVPQCD